MTDDYAALLALAEAATPGPWEETGTYGRIVSGSIQVGRVYGDDGRSTPDAAYIAAASPDVVARLIADLRRESEAGDEATQRACDQTSRAVAAEAEVARLLPFYEETLNRAIDGEES
jgi:hypothetical protein